MADHLQLAYVLREYLVLLGFASARAERIDSNEAHGAAPFVALQLRARF